MSNRSFRAKSSRHLSASGVSLNPPTKGSKQHITRKGYFANKLESVVLYLDVHDDDESRNVQRLLDDHSIEVHIVRVHPGYGEHYPLAIYQAWQYEGLDKINIMVSQIENARVRGEGNNCKQVG